ncbi:MAG: tripartite tricarboxylate transporter substrate binding protein [Betaproteobacteria bacterium]
MKLVALALSACVAAAAPLTVCGQSTYPAKPVRVILGFPPGAAADVVTRIVAAKLSEDLKQGFVVENRPGASSNIAAEQVVRSPADGYTLLMGTIANTINASLYKKLSFDFARDLAPIASIASVPNLLVVHPSLPARSVKELVAVARAHPNEILFGSSGNGTSPHLSGVLFNSMAQVKMVHVPYKGSPQAVTDLVAGRVQVMFAPASTALPFIKSGKLRALAASTIQRAAIVPELPTVSEAGVKGFETSIWFALFAPEATPKDVIGRLNAASVKAVADSEVKHKLAVQGIDALGGTVAQTADLVRSEIAKWARVVRESGATVD